MSKAPMLPVELVDAVLRIIQKINFGDEELQMITIVCKTGAPPTMVSTIVPSQVPEILQWLIDHHDTARVETSDPPGRH